MLSIKMPHESIFPSYVSFFFFNIEITFQSFHINVFINQTESNRKDTNTIIEEEEEEEEEQEEQEYMQMKKSDVTSVKIYEKKTSIFFPS